ncbi:hypothetical protein [Streptomyces sp. NPDC047974]|uniref:hypothetical protein n=1 Tax=Streptomyces sp. NPDC047974 TaxID=3154343 RepID=UPI0034108804
MLRTRIAETTAVVVLALGAALLGTAVQAGAGPVVAGAPVVDTVPVAGTDNMTWQ